MNINDHNYDNVVHTLFDGNTVNVTMPCGNIYRVHKNGVVIRTRLDGETVTGPAAFIKIPHCKNHKACLRMVLSIAIREMQRAIKTIHQDAARDVERTVPIFLKAMGTKKRIPLPGDKVMCHARVLADVEATVKETHGGLFVINTGHVYKAASHLDGKFYGSTLALRSCSLIEE